MTSNLHVGGNVGIGGDSGTEILLVTGSERVTSNLHVGGNLVVDGSFNFSEVIQNITTVNNEVILSTQLDISNQGTGPALKVSQFGVGDDQDVALFNADTEGDAFKIDSSGNSHFYKDVDVSGGVSVGGVIKTNTDSFFYVANLTATDIEINGNNDILWNSKILGSNINNSKYFIAKYTGYYYIACNIFGGNGSTGNMRVGIKVNDVVYQNGKIFLVSHNNLTINDARNGGIIIYINSNDKISLYNQINNVILRIYQPHTYFNGYYIGSS